MNRNVNALIPMVAKKCREFLAACQEQGLELCVINTLRTEDEQRALYAQGREGVDVVNALREAAALAPITDLDNRVVTSAPVSAHQSGGAFDIVLTRGGVPHWDTTIDINDNSIADYIEAGSVGEALGLTWGGRFQIRDYCHYQYTPALGDQTHTTRSLGGVSIAAKEQQMAKTKVGLKSTEFYLAILGSLIPVLNTHLGMSIPTSGVMSIAGVIITYIISRTVVKK
jgi:peptidoglycan L-alanyl-D-glutamate endopeptidase CwlK